MKRGYISLRRLIPDNALCCMPGETRWFASAGREFGLWYLTLHGFGLYVGIIGPFEFGRKA